MNKKVLFQVFIFLFFLTSIIFFYYIYFHEKKEGITAANTINETNDLKIKNNLIKDIEYFSVDKEGNKYLIASKYGEISAENSNLILMKNVKATISLIDREIITISSNLAKYNNKSFDTNFINNVTLEYLDNKIMADNIDLSIQEQFVQAYNNVIYTNQANELIADKIEIDLITKNSKILMNNNKKIKIIGK